VIWHKFPHIGKRMAKPKPEAYVLVPDSNALFSKDIERVVSKSFEENLKQSREIASMKLCIPHVVREELLFQKYYVACKSNENAQISLGNVATITGTKVPKLKTHTYIKQRVHFVFDNWAKANDAKIVKTPYSRIKWSKLQNSAVWRIPPFSPPDENNPQFEKGFRDALILETLCEIVRTHPSVAVVFITGDKLLRFSVDERPPYGNLSIFESIREFKSHLKLLNENRTKRFSAALLANGPKCFYTQGDPKCVYNAANIPALVKSKFGVTLDEPKDEWNPYAPAGSAPTPAIISKEYLEAKYAPAPVGQIGPALAALFTRQWKPASEEKVYIRDTLFQKMEGDRIVWQTRVDFVRAFGHDGPPILMVTLPGTDDRIRIAQIDVIWDASVSDDGVLSEPKVREIKLATCKFEQLTIERGTTYGFLNPSRLMPMASTPG
jgi:hypothetical protein